MIQRRVHVTGDPKKMISWQWKSSDPLDRPFESLGHYYNQRSFPIGTPQAFSLHRRKYYF